MAKRRNNGEGSISYRSDGRWQGTIQLDGKRRYVYGATRAEVVARLRELRKQHEQGIDLDRRLITLSQWAAHWLASRRDGWSSAYYRFAEQSLRLHCLPALGNAIVARLTVLEVERWVAGIENRKTAAVALRVLRHCIADAVRAQIVTSNVAALATTPRVEWRQGKAMTVGQAAKLLAQARSLPLRGGVPSCAGARAEDWRNPCLEVG